VKAIVLHRYGGPGGLALEDVNEPTINDDELLVRVRASSVNPQDWYFVTGTPYVARMSYGLRRPKQSIPGTDMAGVVEAVGRNVTQFKAGDAIFGMRGGAFAEYVGVRADRVVAKPARLTVEQAAAVPVAGLTALQGLRDKGRIQAGQQVLINGASGGVGTFAVQIAKSFGAIVTAVCSSRNVDAVRALGADDVIDYTRADFVHSGVKYDLIFDVAGNRSLSDRRRAMTPQGTLVLVGGPKRSKWLGPLTDFAKVAMAARFGRQTLVTMLAKNSRDDLAVMAELMESGKVTPVIERTYPLAEVPAALSYLGEGHARGKIVITV
jgi:NADPH:quinone reductase-like Zn-dependent oxidoreductase